MSDYKIIVPIVTNQRSVFAGVTDYYKQSPLGPSCDSDWDGNGYTALEYDILNEDQVYDRELEATLDKADYQRITIDVLGYIKDYVEIGCCDYEP